MSGPSNQDGVAALLREAWTNGGKKKKPKELVPSLTKKATK